MSCMEHGAQHPTVSNARPMRHYCCHSGVHDATAAAALDITLCLTEELTFKINIFMRAVSDSQGMCDEVRAWH